MADDGSDGTRCGRDRSGRVFHGDAVSERIAKAGAKTSTIASVGMVTERCRERFGIGGLCNARHLSGIAGDAFDWRGTVSCGVVSDRRDSA